MVWELCTRSNTHISFALGSMAVFFVDINHFLHFIITAHEDSGPIVNMLWNNRNHAFHAAVDGLATSCGNTSACRT